MRKILSVKNLLLVLALAFIASMAIGATSVKAGEVTPAAEPVAEAANDVLEYAPATDSIQVKAAATNDTYFLYLLKKDEAAKVSTRTTPVEITKGTPLNIIETFKIKPDKDLLIYCSTAPIEAGKTTGKANFKIGATPYSKLTITADYTALDTTDGCGIATIVATKKADKKNLVIFNKYAEGVDAAKRAAKAAEDAVWEWSEDGTTWQAAKTCKLTLNTTAYIRVKGDATANIRCSKVYKIKFAKEQKAKTVKVDVKKMTIALKNGYEYAVKPAEDAEDKTLVWTVILPYNKNSKNAEAELAGVNYKPVDKKDEAYNTTYSTKTKVSSISIIDIENYQRGIYVRALATLKKPATPESLVEIPEMTTAPVVKIEGQEAAAAKGDIITTGTAIEFDMPAVENGTGDENAAVYELAVIKKANFTDINWATVSWKKVKPNAKKAIKATLKTKYTAGTTKVEAKASDSGTMIVVRRAGVKAGNILPSKLLVLCVDKVDKDYYLRVNALNLAYDAETAPEALAAPEVPAEPQPEPSPEP